MMKLSLMAEVFQTVDEETNRSPVSDEIGRRWNLNGAEVYSGRGSETFAWPVQVEAKGKTSHFLRFSGKKERFRRYIEGEMHFIQHLLAKGLPVLKPVREAISTVVNLSIASGDTVVVEDPGYRGAHAAVREAGGEVVAASVDSDGLNVQEWDARLLFTTPNHQFPTGCTMSLERRLSLLDWARRKNATIIEDDYDTEFRRHRGVLESLKGLDTDDRVVHVGSLSTSIGRNLRIGYVVPTTRMREAFDTASRSICSAGMIEQAAVASFMSRGFFRKYLKKASAVLAEREVAFCEASAEYLGKMLTTSHTSVGTRVFGRWRLPERDVRLLEAAARRAGIVWDDPADGFLTRRKPCALFNLGGVERTEIGDTLRQVGEIARSVLEK